MHISQLSTAQISVPEGHLISYHEPVANQFSPNHTQPKKSARKAHFPAKRHWKEYLKFLLSYGKALENIWLVFCILTSLNMRHQSKLNNTVIYIPFRGRERRFIPRWREGKWPSSQNCCSALKAAVILTFTRTESFDFSNDPLVVVLFRND